MISSLLFISLMRQNFSLNLKTEGSMTMDKNLTTLSHRIPERMCAYQDPVWRQYSHCPLNKELMSKKEPAGKRLKVKGSEEKQASRPALNPRTEIGCPSQRLPPLKSEIVTWWKRTWHSKMDGSKGHC